VLEGLNVLASFTNDTPNVRIKEFFDRVAATS
jgi:hypothetical protein